MGQPDIHRAENEFKNNVRHAITESIFPRFDLSSMDTEFALLGLLAQGEEAIDFINKLTTFNWFRISGIDDLETFDLAALSTIMRSAQKILDSGVPATLILSWLQEVMAEFGNPYTHIVM